MLRSSQIGVIVINSFQPINSHQHRTNIIILMCYIVVTHHMVTSHVLFMQFYKCLCVLFVLNFYFSCLDAFFKIVFV